AAIEPQRTRRTEAVARIEAAPIDIPAPAPVEVEPEPEPVLAAVEAPEPEPVVAPAPPRVFEPLRAASYAPSAPPAPPATETVVADQADFAFDEPEIAAALAPAPQAEPVRTVARIVDPSVADEDDEPLFPQTHYAEERGRKGG